jgi:DNA modification methylase
VIVHGTNHTDKRHWNHARNGRGEVQPIDKRPGWKRQNVVQGSFCGCGSWRGALGLEPTPELYTAHLVDVFREVRRVLRDDGTLWLNLGDSYTSGNRPAYDRRSNNRGNHGITDSRLRQPADLKPKDLIGIPWRVALALQADGWYLRSDIIWAKSNPMPESVTDRPTKSHEYLFLLSKRERYFYDANAIREPLAYPGRTYKARTDELKTRKLKTQSLRCTPGLHDGRTLCGSPELGRNKRSVWTIPTEPYAGAHFATYPTRLVEPCIKAGSSERGCCRSCGAPWQRMLKKTPMSASDYNGKWSTTDPQSNARRNQMPGACWRIYAPDGKPERTTTNLCRHR